MAKLMKKDDESLLYNSLTISRYAFLLSIGCSEQMLKKDKWSKLVECVNQMIENSCEDDHQILYSSSSRVFARMSSTREFCIFVFG